ncbi:hypothetical protein D8I30_08790 [Brevundimonas naejangsanensis]|uniref:Uncharacterized protein n=1 Tax=Brevundimonas naejangsanensis TaxID=588932 RepID=A0A494RNN5_9CAUL|nr:hypothetical protein [Brevundimonas naejangsanensis]AYG95264.1 hypothetical protein D8I30_08790 [Brevundimonas naejangsanensis]
MMPTVIVLLLVIVALAAVVWVVRRGPPHVPHTGEDQDTAWNDPITPADEEDEAEPPLSPREDRP